MLLAKVAVTCFYYWKTHVLTNPCVSFFSPSFLLFKLDILAFAECCKEYPLMFPWKCSAQSALMNECVGRYGSPAMFDKLREEYIERKINYRKKVEDEK